MSAIPNVKQGESFDFFFDLNGESLTGWTCQVEVKRFKTDSSALVSRAVTATGTKFETFLTQTETAAFVVGHHVIIGRLSKTSTDEEDQQEITIHVTGAWL